MASGTDVSRDGSIFTANTKLSLRKDFAWWSYTGLHACWFDRHPYNSAVDTTAMPKVRLAVYLSLQNIPIQCLFLHNYIFASFAFGHASLMKSSTSCVNSFGCSMAAKCPPLLCSRCQIRLPVCAAQKVSHGS
jgi:hypothetical protein